MKHRRRAKSAPKIYKSAFVSKAVRRITSRPEFQYLDHVYVSNKGLTNSRLEGFIVGRSSQIDIFDWWIVRLKHCPNKTYDFSCICVPHDRLRLVILKHRK